MSPKIKMEYTTDVSRMEYTTDVSRAIRDAQRILLRNDLNPFELVVEIRAAPVDDGETAYVLEISTMDRAVSVQRSRIPCACIEDRQECSHDAFSVIVEGLVPELLDGMKSARSGSPMITLWDEIGLDPVRR